MISHASDCAIYNAPALPIGPCDCGADESRTDAERQAIIAAVDDGLRECDCCGEMKSDTRAVCIPHAGDTVVCEDCSR